MSNESCLDILRRDFGWTGEMDINYLAKEYEDERDKYIEFDEGPHIYTISLPNKEPDSTYTSVTTWVHSHFDKFDADKIIDKILKSPKYDDPTYKYYHLTREHIKEMWDKNRDEAADAGTKMHYDIECYYNDTGFDDISRLESDEFKYFLEFEDKRMDGEFGNIEPYRTEWTVFDEDAKLSGSIDMVYIDIDTEELLIYDWKRCRDIKKENRWQSAKTKGIKHLPDVNYWHYALQLNIYRYILQKNYGYKVRELYLVGLHPNKGTYQRLEVPMLDKEMDVLFKQRYNDVKMT